jgi:hypothetical protein
MYNIPGDALDALQATPTVLQAVLRGCTQEQARAARGGDEDWSVVEVVCHLRDGEERALERMRAMRDGENPFLAGYDQAVWATERHYATENLRTALAAFLTLRTQHTSELAALTSEQWERGGRHEEQGQITILAHTIHITAHDAIHAAQIGRQLGGQ